MSGVILLTPDQFDQINSKLDFIAKSIRENNEKPESKWLTAKETMQLLDIKETTLWNYRKQGRIKAQKINRKLYFLKEDVDRLISSGGV